MCCRRAYWNLRVRVGFAVFGQPDVSFRKPKFFKCLKGNFSTSPWPGLIRLVNSTYRVRGDFVTARQLLRFPRFDEWDGKQMINAPPVAPCREKTTCSFRSICSAHVSLTQEEKWVCVCVYTSTKEPLSPYGTAGEWHHRFHCGAAQSWD